MSLLVLTTLAIAPAAWAQVRYRPLSSFDDQPTRAERLRDLRSAPVEIALDGERNDQLVLRRGGNTSSPNRSILPMARSWSPS